MWLSRTNYEVFQYSSKRYDGSGFIASIVQLLASTEANAGVGELLTSEKLCDGQGATANAVNDVVIRDYRQTPDQLRPKGVDEWIEILLPSVVLTAVYKLTRKTRFKVLAHILPVVILIYDTGKLLEQR